MKNRIIGLTVVSLSALFLYASSASAATLSLFGFEFNANDTPRVQSQVSSAPAATNDVTEGDTTEGCLQYANHEYEVCIAYIFNSSLADLLPYYKYIHSTNASLSGFVQYRLGSRYTGQANMLLQNRVASWPIGNMDVDIPYIKITSINSSLTTNTATLTTVESWKVIATSGQVSYQENKMHHTVTMQRVPSYLLHKWVVTNIQ